MKLTAKKSDTSPLFISSQFILPTRKTDANLNPILFFPFFPSPFFPFYLGGGGGGGGYKNTNIMFRCQLIRPRSFVYDSSNVSQIESQIEP